MTAPDRPVADLRDPAVRVADSLADLADTLGSFRVLIEREEDRLAKERADDADREARRQPARWHTALQEVRQQMRGIIREAVGGPITLPADVEHTLADQLTTILDKRLRSSWGLRDAFRTLGSHQPPEDLADVAHDKAVAALGTAASDEDRERWIETWLAGATYDVGG